MIPLGRSGGGVDDDDDDFDVPKRGPSHGKRPPKLTIPRGSPSDRGYRGGSPSGYSDSENSDYSDGNDSFRKSPRSPISSYSSGSRFDRSGHNRKKSDTRDYNRGRGADYREHGRRSPRMISKRDSFTSGEWQVVRPDDVRRDDRTHRTQLELENKRLKQENELHRLEKLRIEEQHKLEQERQFDHELKVAHKRGEIAGLQRRASHVDRRAYDDYSVDYDDHHEYDRPSLHRTRTYASRPGFLGAARY